MVSEQDSPGLSTTSEALADLGNVDWLPAELDKAGRVTFSVFHWEVP